MVVVVLVVVVVVGLVEKKRSLGNCHSVDLLLSVGIPHLVVTVSSRIGLSLLLLRLPLLLLLLQLRQQQGSIGHALECRRERVRHLAIIC